MVKALKFSQFKGGFGGGKSFFCLKKSLPVGIFDVLLFSGSSSCCQARFTSGFGVTRTAGGCGKGGSTLVPGVSVSLSGDQISSREMWGEGDGRELEKRRSRKEGITGVEKMLKKRAHGQGRVCGEQTDSAGQRSHHESTQVLQTQPKPCWFWGLAHPMPQCCRVPWGGWPSEGLRVWAGAVAGPQLSHEHGQCQHVCVPCPRGTPEPGLTHHVSKALSSQTSAFADSY